MLRVYFPAGEPIQEAWSHSDFKKAFGGQDDKEGDSDAESVRLLSRIFSLVEKDLGPKAAPALLRKE